MPSVPRASANDAFVCALRQLPSPGCIHAGNVLPLTLLSFCGHLALCLGKYFSSKQMKKNGVFETLVQLHAALLRAALRAASASSGPLPILALGALLRSVSPSRWRSSPQRFRSMAFGQWRSTALFTVADVLLSCSSDWRREILLPL